MIRSKRWTTVVSTVLICALALAFGVLPSAALIGGNADRSVPESFDVADKFPQNSIEEHPRFRVPAEMALIEMNYGSLETPDLVVASATDETYVPEVVYSVAELEQFRADFIDYMRDYDAVVATLQTTEWSRAALMAAEVDPDTLSVATEQLYASIASLDYAPLADAKRAMDSDPAWRGRPDELNAAIELYGQALAVESGVPSALGVSPAWEVSAPPFDYDGLIFTARYAAVAAAVAMELLPDDITAGALGVTASVPSPFNIAATIAWGVAEAATISLEIGQDNRDDYFVDYLVDHAHRTGERVRDNLDLSVSSVDSRLATHNTTVVNRFTAVDTRLVGLEAHLVTQDGALSALEAHMAAQDADRTARFNFVDSEIAAIRSQLSAQDAYMAETRTLMMRMAIEENLLSDAPPLATFQLPASQGGSLDEVRAIVAETIANMRAAGLSVNNADTEFRRADAASAVGDYKGAYAKYRTAYREAIR